MMTANTNKLSLKKNDLVQVISGKEKGKTGKVTHIDTKSMKVTIEKLNMVKRHMKPSQTNPQGGITEKELPIHYAKVLLVCPKCNKGSRVGHKVVEAAAKKSAKGAAAGAKAKKVRFCKRCDAVIDQSV